MNQSNGYLLQKKKRNLYKLLFLLKLIAPLQWFLKDQDIKFGV